METVHVCSLADDPALRDQVVDLYERGWPTFMGQDPVDVVQYPQLLEHGPQHQLLAVDGQETVMASVHLVPLVWRPGDELPDGGWDWAFTTGVQVLRAGTEPTALCALAMTIDPARRGQGLGTILSAAMLEHGARQGCEAVVIPLRPTGKADEPLVAFDEYIARRRPDGLPTDAWLRAQVRAGGDIGPVCWRSMRIAGTLEQWETWTGVAHVADRPYVVPHALVPLVVEGGRATYVEPNVWIIHRLAPARDDEPGNLHVT